MGRNSNIGGGQTVIMQPFVDKDSQQFLFKVSYCTLPEDHPSYNDFKKGKTMAGYSMVIDHVNLVFNKKFSNGTTVIPAHWKIELVEIDNSVAGDTITFKIQMQTAYERTLKMMNYLLTQNGITLGGSEIGFYLKRSKGKNSDKYYDNVFFSHDGASVDYMDDANSKFPFGKLDSGYYGYRGITPVVWEENPRNGKMESDSTGFEQNFFYVLKTWANECFDKPINLTVPSDKLQEVKGWADTICHPTTTIGTKNKYLNAINVIVRDVNQSLIIRDYMREKGLNVGVNQYDFLEFNYDDSNRETESANTAKPTTKPPVGDEMGDDLPF